MSYIDEEHFLAVAVGPMEGPPESWRMNFGATPFKYPLPDGYRPYGGPQRK